MLAISSTKQAGHLLNARLSFLCGSDLSQLARRDRTLEAWVEDEL